MMEQVLGGERKISMSNEGFIQTTFTSTTNSNPTASTNPPDQTQNLRCPRCDSTNTKFCYYNNYNLTQPRHFCKTCRRYWTKGGALRNVPIGGGCRKNKATTTNISASTFGKPTASSRLKSSFSISEIGKQIFLGTGFDHDLPTSSVNSLLWSPPQNSHILALLRGNSNSNTNTSLSSGVQLRTEAPINGAQLYNTNQIPTYWRTNQQQPTSEGQNSGIQELLQKLKTSTGGYYGNPHGPVLSSNAVSSSSNNGSSIILESAPVSGGDFSYVNSSFSWSDVATPSGAYP